jgi:octaprenyl-diphosphate synthase
LDLKEHKVTLPLIAALPRMTQSERDRVEEFFADPAPDHGSVGEIVSIVASNGGLDRARSRAEGFAREAEQALAALPESPFSASLYGAITYVTERQS